MLLLLSVGIECFSSIIFIIPAILIIQYILFKQHSFSKFIMALIFSFYLIAVFSVTGIPSAYTLKLNFGFNLIPLIDIVNSPIAYIINTVLNIVLFMPLGFLLPSIWKEYQSANKTVLTGFAVSAIIEFLQIFSFRLTDIDDLITNTLGTVLGYFIGKMFSFKLPIKISTNNKNNNYTAVKYQPKYEPVILFIAVLITSFFLKPFVSDTIWDVVLDSPLWDSIAQ